MTKTNYEIITQKAQEFINSRNEFAMDTAIQSDANLRVGYLEMRYEEGEKLARAVIILTEALEFYGNMGNWNSVTDGHRQYLFVDKDKGDWEYIPGNELMIQTGGAISRKALSEASEVVSG